MHPRFERDRLEIRCTGALRTAHAIELAEMLQLGVTYYCYRCLVLELRGTRLTRGALAVLQRAYAYCAKRGVEINVRGPRVYSAVMRGQSMPRVMRSSIGFTSSNAACVPSPCTVPEVRRGHA